MGSRLRFRTLYEVERDAILDALARTNGNRSAAARILDTSVRNIRNKIAEYRESGFEIIDPPGRVGAEETERRVA